MLSKCEYVLCIFDAYDTNFVTCGLNFIVLFGANAYSTT